MLKRSAVVFVVLAILGMLLLLAPATKTDAASRVYKGVSLVNDTGAHGCWVVMYRIHTGIGNRWRVKGWSCLEAGKSEALSGDINHNRFYVYGFAHNKLFSKSWNRRYDLPEGGQPIVIDTRNGISYYFDDGGNGYNNSKNSIAEGFESCGRSNVTADCRSVAAVPVSATQTSNNYLILNLSDVGSRARGVVTEW